MKISEKWLRSFIKTDKTIEEIAEILTLRGLEVESITPVAANLSHVVVAEILLVEKHPNADRLRVCQVSDGKDKMTIVCGAPNARVGIKVVLAKVGAVLPQVTIKKSKIRDVESYGMLCSVSELGLANHSEGIMELPADAVLGQSLTEYLDLDDNIIDISVTPNRGDCASVFGIAREVAAIEGTQWIDYAVPVEKAILSETKLDYQVVADQACTSYLMVKLKDIHLTTPMWMKERLRRSGFRSVNLPVDVTNYTMLEFGQPLHAFDADKILGKIEVRFAKKNETLLLLNDVTISLDEKSLIIADAEGPIALAGIMGGKRTSVSENTVAVMLECAHFCPEIIARTARHFNLSSDSSYRFERGVDPLLPAYALDRAVQLIVSASPLPAKLNQHAYLASPVVLRIEKLKKVLGIDIELPQIKQYLSALNIKIEETREGLTLTPPSYRFDLTIEEDFIEEVLRLHGCDAVMAIAPHPSLSLQAKMTTNNADVARMILKARAYAEIISYSFVDEKLQQALFPHHKAIKLLNPISQDMAVMRTSLWTGLLSTLMYNLNQNPHLSQLRLFEVGLCFEGDQQQRKIAGLSYGRLYPELPGAMSSEIDFFDVKNDLEAIFFEHGVETVCVFNDDLMNTSLHPRQATQFIDPVRGKVIATLGVLHPRLVDQFSLSSAPVLFEIDSEALYQAIGRRSYQALSKFPAAMRDLAFIISTEYTYQEIQKAIQSLDHQRIRALTVFDIYRGKGIPEACQSMAIRLTLQDAEKTLTHDEIALLIQRVVELMKERFNATLRD